MARTYSMLCLKRAWWVKPALKVVTLPMLALHLIDPAGTKGRIERIARFLAYRGYRIECR